MPSPPTSAVSLSDAVNLIVKRRKVTEPEAREALRAAGLDGLLDATGQSPRSILPTGKAWAAHPIRSLAAVAPQDWSIVDWELGSVGRCLDQKISLASLDRWLGPAKPDDRDEGRCTRSSKPTDGEDLRQWFVDCQEEDGRPPSVARA